MKWFKHMVDSAIDPDVREAVLVYGSDAYYVFFTTLEIMSREFDVKNPGKNVFDVEDFKRRFLISWTKTKKILQFFDEKQRISSRFSVRPVSKNDNRKREYIELSCSKLKDLCDEYTQKKIKVSGFCPDSCREQEVEGEVDKRTLFSAVAKNNDVDDDNNDNKNVDEDGFESRDSNVTLVGDKNVRIKYKTLVEIPKGLRGEIPRSFFDWARMRHDLMPNRIYDMWESFVKWHEKYSHLNKGKFKDWRRRWQDWCRKDIKLKTQDAGETPDAEGRRRIPGIGPQRVITPENRKEFLYGERKLNE